MNRVSEDLMYITCIYRVSIVYLSCIYGHLWCTQEGGYIEVIRVFEDLMPDIIPLSDMQIHHK